MAANSTDLYIFVLLTLNKDEISDRRCLLLGSLIPAFMHYWNNLLCGVQTNLQLACHDDMESAEAAECLQDATACLTTCISKMKEVQLLASGSADPTSDVAPASLVVFRLESFLQYFIKYKKNKFSVDLEESMEQCHVPNNRLVLLYSTATTMLFPQIEEGTTIAFSAKSEPEPSKTQFEMIIKMSSFPEDRECFLLEKLGSTVAIPTKVFKDTDDKRVRVVSHVSSYYKEST